MSLPPGSDGLTASAPVSLRRMTSDDLAAADRIRKQVGFNQRIADWQNLLDWEPEGCFVAVSAGSVVGTVTTTTFGRDLAWIGMLLVDREARRRGVGRRLLGAALQALDGVGCVALDATPAGRELYLQHGFVDRIGLQRWEGDLQPGTVPTPPDAEVTVELMGEADLDRVVALDELACGVRRDRVLERLFLASPQTCWVARRSGQVVGSALSRPGAVRHVLGPVVTADPTVAPGLVAAVLDALGPRPLVVDVADRSVLEPVLADRGLARARPLIRMSRAPLPPARFEAYQAIAGPEIG